MVRAAPMECELQRAAPRVPAGFSDFIPTTTEAAAILPKHGAYGHAIDLKESIMPLWGPIYALSEAELEELRNRLKEMTEIGAIRPLKPACSSPMLFFLIGHGCGPRL